MAKIILNGSTSGSVTLESPAVAGTTTLTLPTTSGTVLTNGTNTNFPAGSVLQTVSVFDNTRYTFNSGSSNQITFYDISGLQLSITPKSATSKILLLGMVSGGHYTNVYNAYFRFDRNGTNIGSGGSTDVKAGSTAMTAFRSVGDQSYQITIPMIFLDSPATTSAITYKIQICNSGGSGYPAYINRSYVIDANWQQGSGSSITALEIAA